LVSSSVNRTNDNIPCCSCKDELQEVVRKGPGTGRGLRHCCLLLPHWKHQKGPWVEDEKALTVPSAGEEGSASGVQGLWVADGVATRLSTHVGLQGEVRWSCLTRDRSFPGSQLSPSHHHICVQWATCVPFILVDSWTLQLCPLDLGHLFTAYTGRLYLGYYHPTQTDNLVATRTIVKSFIM
jgi:hypothetical protein